MSDSKTFESWAIVEVMGHRQFAGYVSEQAIGGASFVRVDVPEVHAGRTDMKERPILFSGPMVRAILEDRKTVTRRVVKPQPLRSVNDWSFDAEVGERVMYRDWPHYLQASRGRNKAAAGELTPMRKPCPYGRPGDRLVVKETWRTLRCYDDLPPRDIPRGSPVEYDCDKATMHWPLSQSSPLGVTRPSIFMPRWASRLTLEIVSVRAERLQSITEEDAKAEGANAYENDDYDEVDPGEDQRYTYRSGFRTTWDALNAKRGFSWESNCWVWVVEFKRC